MLHLFKLPIIILLTGFTFTNWQPDFETAKKVAAEKHQLILLNFSGSDWCGPCIRMKKEVFENESFSKMADSSLVLLNADFPRTRKKQLTTKQQDNNDKLAEIYNPSGKFPFTVLMNADGKVLKSWDGLPSENAMEFTAIVKRLCDDSK
jgi:thioredoxin-related protein